MQNIIDLTGLLANSGVGTAGTALFSLVAAGTNVRGIIVVSLQLGIAAVAGAEGRLAFTMGTTPFFVALAPAGSTVNVPFNMSGPVFIPAGLALQYQNYNATPYNWNVGYRIL